MTTAFDPATFLNQSTEQASTRRTPLTAGSEFVGVLGTPAGRQVQGKKDPSKMYTFFDYPVEIDLAAYPEEKQRVGMDKVTLRYSISLDVTSNGTIDWSPGHNTGLRYLREATGMNEAGQAFSMQMLTGRPIRVKIGHEEYPEGSGELVDRIVGVAKP